MVKAEKLSPHYLWPQIDQIPIYLVLSCLPKQHSGTRFAELRRDKLCGTPTLATVKTTPTTHIFSSISDLKKKKKTQSSNGVNRLRRQPHRAPLCDGTEVGVRCEAAGRGRWESGLPSPKLQCREVGYDGRFQTVGCGGRFWIVDQWGGVGWDG